METSQCVVAVATTRSAMPSKLMHWEVEPSYHRGKLDCSMGSFSARLNDVT